MIVDRLTDQLTDKLAELAYLGDCLAMLSIHGQQCRDWSQATPLSKAMYRDQVATEVSPSTSVAHRSHELLMALAQVAYMNGSLTLAAHGTLRPGWVDATEADRQVCMTEAARELGLVLNA